MINSHDLMINSLVVGGTPTTAGVYSGTRIANTQNPPYTLAPGSFSICLHQNGDTRQEGGSGKKQQHISTKLLFG